MPIHEFRQKPPPEDKPVLTLGQLIKLLQELAFTHDPGLPVWLEGCDCYGACSGASRMDNGRAFLSAGDPKGVHLAGAEVVRPRRPRRLLLVSDGGTWWVRKVAYSVESAATQMLVYHCDEHLGGPYDTLSKAVKELKKLEGKK